ncbi:hypothetical protein PMAYCL1PPCAC_20438, partial [Pristionchus mayeri]
VATHMVANNAVLVGVNIDHDELCAFGEANIPASTVPAPRPTASPYVGGEMRNKTDAEFAYVSIAGQGAALGDVSARAVQEVLLVWLGSQVTRPGLESINTGALEGITNKYSPSSVTCSAMYFEGEGLIQFHIEAPISYVRFLVKDVVNLLKNFKIDNLKEIKKVAKEKIITMNKTRKPRVAAIERAMEIFAGVEK